MDILSREMQALVRVPAIRAAIDRLLDDPLLPSVTVTLDDGRTVTIRRV